MKWRSVKGKHKPLPGTLVWLAWNNGAVSISYIRKDGKVDPISFDPSVSVTHWRLAKVPRHPKSFMAKG